MATLGSLTKSVPITPRQDRETAGVPTVDPAGADLIQDAIDQIRRYTSELTSYDVVPFPPAPESTIDNKLSRGPGQPTFTAAGDLDTIPDRDTFASAGREQLDFENGYAELPAGPGYGVDSTGIVDVTQEAPGVVGYAAGVLANNRFSGLGSDRFIDNGNRTAKSQVTTSTPGLAADRLYSPTGGPGRALSASAAATGNVGSDEIALLKNVAMRLLVQATGKKSIANSLAQDTTDGSIRRNRAKAKAIPSAAQLGLKRVDGDALQAATGPAALGSAAGKAESLGYAGEGRPSGQSYGVLNSPLQVWEDDTALLATATAGVLALIGISLTLSLVGNNQRKAVDADVRTTDLGHGTAGLRPLNGQVGPQGDRQRRLAAAANTLAGIGILPAFNIETRHPTAACIAKGLRVFFGGDSAGSSFSKILASSAYFANINRSVARDMDQVKTAFTSIGQNPAGILRLGDAMEQSTTFRFMKTMAALGDVTLTGDAVTDPKLQLRPRGLGSDELSAQSYGMMSILPRSFTSSAAIAMLYGDAGPMRAEVLARSETLRTPLGDDDSTPVSPQRIPIKLLQQYEAQLDAQAFPFTFHDTRTNELVEFGAFIESMTDGFSPSYNSTPAYGRTEDVMTYASTKRNIGLSFWIVATNPQDHDLMWRKINKLTTLVYPQYSKGRLISKNGNTFRMPFSQVMTASPLIRLRIGETLTGNYSRFNLTRLFGSGEAMQGNGGIQFTDDKTNELLDAIASTARFGLTTSDGTRLTLNDLVPDGDITATGYFERALRKTSDNVKLKYAHGFSVDDRVVLKRSVLATMVPIEDADRGEKIKQRLRTATGLGSGPDLQISRSMVDANTPCVIKRVASAKQLYFVAPLRSSDEGEAESGEGFLVDHKSLTFDPSALLLGALSDGAIVDDEERDEDPEAPQLFDVDNLNAFTSVLQDFFSTGGNPIVKSFERTRSRGLAGFVTSLSFDYGDSTFEMAQGARAPMTVKVSMEFSPIHDIAPGLDADGANRAPIYTPGHFNASAAGHRPNGFADIGLPPGDGVASFSKAAERYRGRIRADAQEELNTRRAEAVQAPEPAPTPTPQRAARSAEGTQAVAVETEATSEGPGLLERMSTPSLSAMQNEYNGIASALIGYSTNDVLIDQRRSDPTVYNGYVRREAVLRNRIRAETGTDPRPGAFGTP